MKITEYYDICIFSKYTKNRLQKFGCCKNNSEMKHFFRKIRKEKFKAYNNKVKKIIVNI